MCLQEVLINKFKGNYYCIFTMTAQNSSISIKDRIAMFQKLNSGSAPPLPQKKQLIAPIAKSNPIPVAEKAPQNKSTGVVESPPIVKPNMIKQSQQSPFINNVNGSPNKLASSFTNNPWVQQASTAKVQEKKAPVAPVTAFKQPKAQGQQVFTLKQTFSENEGTGTGKSQPQKIVKITQNAQVDKQALPSQTAMKLLIEGRLGGLIGFKKPEQPPKKAIVDVDSSPKQAPVVQTNVKIGNVKANTEKFNNFFQAKESQKLQASKEQANRKKQAQQQVFPNTENKESQPTKQQQVKQVQVVQQVSQVNNSQNINVGLVFSQPEPIPSIPQSNVLNVPPLSASLGQSAESESKESKGQDNSLTTRLIKRKKMTKASFDSDQD